MKNNKFLRETLSWVMHFILVVIIVMGLLSIFTSRWSNQTSPKISPVAQPISVLKSVNIPILTPTPITLLTKTPPPTKTYPTSTPTLELTLVPQSTVEPSSISPKISASPTTILYPTTVWTPPAIVTKVTDNWLLHVDEEAGYSFKYPPEIRLSGGKSKGEEFKHVSGFLPSQKFSPQIIVIVDSNNDNLTLEQYLVKIYPKYKKQPQVLEEYLTTIEKMTINGFPAVLSKVEKVAEVVIIISAGDKVFYFAISNGISLGDTRTVDMDSKDLFFQIVNTFALYP